MKKEASRDDDDWRGKGGVLPDDYFIYYYPYNESMQAASFS